MPRIFVPVAVNAFPYCKLLDACWRLRFERIAIFHRFRVQREMDLQCERPIVFPERS